MDKVGKTQADLKEGAQIQQSLLGAAIQKKADERVRSVSGTPDTGYGAEGVKDDRRRGGGKESGEGKREAEEAETEDSEVVKDPNLGRNIDISG
jgi:hypothetical protein